MATVDGNVAEPPQAVEGVSRAKQVVLKLLRIIHRHSFIFALALTVILLVLNLIREKGGFGWTGQLADLAPVAIAGMASTPAIISGGGGFDVSISPSMILIDAMYIVWLAPHGLGGWIAVPIMIGAGMLIGLINGLLIIALRVQPIVVTLSMYFIIIGATLQMLPDPSYVSSTWITHLATDVGPIPGAVFTMGVPLLVWLALGRLPYKRMLYAVGSNDATAFSTGINVNAVRAAAYALGGAFAGVGAISVVAVSTSASSSLSTVYTLEAIAAVALGGTSLLGGRGGLFGSFLGAAAIYLLGTLLITLQINPAWLQVSYGIMLVVAVVLVGAAQRASTGTVR